MAVRGQVAAVTGAASGIGRATAVGLSRQGAHLELASRWGLRCHGRPCEWRAGGRG